ncbi:MAG: sigma-70 family RNA polymerase sigma factor [Acidobacteriia bacterium]|nr:sigma-70 family RNA polymerase sigma factor [Terriglobia bacterium]
MTTLITKYEVPISIIPNRPELDDLYRNHHLTVFRTAYRITGNTADAEDVLQTVFLRIVRREDAADVIERPENYLRRAAVHAALDVVRARRSGADIDLDRLPAPSSRPDEGDLRDVLRHALSELPARSAEIFTLRFFEGLTNPEIAKALGISSITVAVTLHRTRRELQKKLRAS